MRSLAMMCAVLLVLSTLVRADDEEKVALDKLPKAVVDAVKGKFPSAKLVGASKEKEDGKVVFEIAIKNGVQNIEVTVAPDGKIVSIEKEITAKDLPKAVAEALEKKYPKATIKKLEEIHKDDKLIKYEALILTSEKKTLEVCFDPSGKFLTEEKKDNEKDEKGEKNHNDEGEQNQKDKKKSDRD
jgi:hypothetical protein